MSGVPHLPGPLLVVTSVPAERDAVCAGLGCSGDRSGPGPVATRLGTVSHVCCVGVGPAMAAASTARILALAEASGTPYASVVCAGIGGGFPGRADLGDLVIGDLSVPADLGADSPGGFLPLSDLGFGGQPEPAGPVLVRALGAALPHAVTGTVLTVSTATGTAERASLLADRYPRALAEGMEGYGVAVAAALAVGQGQGQGQGPVPGAATRPGPGQRGRPAFGELRAISNLVGPRDRESWRIGRALEALRDAWARLAGDPVW